MNDKKETSELARKIYPWQKELTDEERINQMSDIIDYLLPNYKKGDTIHYNSKDYVFSHFTTVSSEGTVFCAMKAVDTDPNDPFSTSLIELHKVRENQSKGGNQDGE